MQGVKSIKQTNLNPRYLFISPPSQKVLVSGVTVPVFRGRPLINHLGLGVVKIAPLEIKINKNTRKTKNEGNL